MPRHGENIYKRKDGRWEGRYIIGYRESGKARYGAVYAHSYQEVKQKLNQAKNGQLVKKPLSPWKNCLICGLSGNDPL